MTAAERKKGEDTPRSEDYLEAVLQLIRDKGYATTSDISAVLKVKPPTVSKMIRRLATKGYLEYERYRGMKLSPSGERIAKSVIKRHQVISEFMSMMGVDEETAFEDTEGIEHHVHQSTLRRLERLGEYLRSNPQALRSIRKFVDER